MEKTTTSGWVKISGAASYAGVGKRTFRKWLKDGLPHSKLHTGTILIQLSAIDEYLKSFMVKDNEVQMVVNSVMAGIRGE